LILLLFFTAVIAASFLTSARIILLLRQDVKPAKVCQKSSGLAAQHHASRACLLASSDWIDKKKSALA